MTLNQLKEQGWTLCRDELPTREKLNNVDYVIGITNCGIPKMELITKIGIGVRYYLAWRIIEQIESK